MHKSNQLNHTVCRVLLWMLGITVFSLGVSYVWRVAYEPAFGALPLTLGTGAAVGGFCLVTAGVVKLCGRRRTLCAALLIFLLGIVFAFVLPPLQAPDETAHFLRSYAVSKGYFDFDAARDYSAELGVLYKAFPSAYYNGYRQSILPNFAQYFAQKESMYVGETMYLLFWPYLPQAAGIALARLVGFGALGQMYAARIANAALYALLCYPALKNCDRYRGILQSVMMLPIGLHIVAGNSYDSWLLGSAFLVFSFFAKNEITRRDLPFMILAALPCSIKMPQLIMLLIWLLIPESRWHVQTRRGKRISPWLVVAAALAATVLCYGIVTAYAGAFSSHYGTIERWNPDVSIPGQIEFVLKNFPRTLAVFVFTLYENLCYLPGLGEFCNLDVAIPAVMLLSLLSISIGMLLDLHQKDADTGHAAIGLVLFGVLYVGVVLAALYVTWTPVGMVRIIGLQTRYFLPALPAFLAAGGWLAGHVLAVRPERAEQIRKTGFWLPYVAGAFSAVLLFQHCYIGPF